MVPILTMAQNKVTLKAPGGGAGGVASGRGVKIVGGIASIDTAAAPALQFLNLVVNNTLIVGSVNATTLAGTLSTNAQPNITSIGTLTNLTVSGNATVTGSLTAGALAGTVITATQPNITSVGTLAGATVTGNTNIIHLVGSGTGPSIGNGVASAVGNSPTTTITGTDLAGKITIATGSTGQNNSALSPRAICAVTFGTAFGTAPRGITLTVHEEFIKANTGAYLPIIVKNVTTTGFDIYIDAGLALNTSTTFYISYTVIQ